MKLISFLSKFTVICNIAFVIFAVVNKLEKNNLPTKEIGLPEVPFLKDLVITLGFSAIFINIVMCLVYLVVIIIGRKYLLPKWLALINFTFLVFQFYFFF